MSARDYGEEDPRDRREGYDEPPTCDTCGWPCVSACPRCAKIGTEAEQEESDYAVCVQAGA